MDDIIPWHESEYWLTVTALPIILGSLDAFNTPGKTKHNDVIVHEEPVHLASSSWKQRACFSWRQAGVTCDLCGLSKGVQQALWRRRHDSQALCEEDGALLHPVYADQLPVPPGLEEADRHRRVSPLLLPQGLRLSPFLDRSQGSLHGCAGAYEKCDPGPFNDRFLFPWTERMAS